MVIGEHSSLKNALWKWGGHPQVLKSAELISMEQELITLASTVDSPILAGKLCNISQRGQLLMCGLLGNEVDPRVYVNVQWKRELIEALATLYFANSQTKNNWEPIVAAITGVPKVVVKSICNLQLFNTFCSTYKES